MLERLKAEGEGDNREWDGWMASPTRWTWFWASSGRWWWTGKPGVLQSMGLQRVRHDWVTELNWTEKKGIMNKRDKRKGNKEGSVVRWKRLKSSILWKVASTSCCLVVSVWPYGLQPARLLSPWDSLQKSTRVGCLALLEGTFLTQGSNPGLLPCRQFPYLWATREAQKVACEDPISGMQITSLKTALSY